MPKENISCVLVTYNPDLEQLHRTLSALELESLRTILVDNNSEAQAAISDMAFARGLPIIHLRTNIGLAAAQNRGIRHAKEQGADYILFMDQDSVLPSGAVDVLLTEYRSLVAEGIRVGSIGPSYFDTLKQEVASAWRSNGENIQQVKLDAATGSVVEVDFVISSGSIIPVAVLREVGGMDAGLFIDLVDLEWGFRATAAGYRHFQSSKVIMKHTLGSGTLRFRSRVFTLHSPIRNYYWVRNAIVLSTRQYVPRVWRQYFRARVWRYIILYGLIADGRMKRQRYMLKGMLHGVYRAIRGIASSSHHSISGDL